MTTLNFPSSPVVGQVFTAEGVSFVWSGAVWYVLDPFPWATAAEGLEGVAQSKISTPAATKALLDTIPAGQTFNFGTPQDMSASRAQSVNYQNTLGRPMMVSINFRDRDNDTQMELLTGPANVTTPPINLGRTLARRGSDNNIIGVIPGGWFYQLNLVTNRGDATSWWEWRN